MRPKTYIKTLYRSFSSARYYLDVLRAPFSFTFRFFLLSYLVIGFVIGVRAAADFERFIQENTEPTLASIEKHFPEDGSIIWGGDSVTVSPDPFFIDFPPYYDSTEGLPEYFALVTAEQLEPSQLLDRLSTSAWLVVSADLIYSANYLNEWTSAPLSQVFEDNLVMVTQETLPQHLETLRSWSYALVPVAQLIVPFMSTALVLLHRLWIALVHAALVYFFLKINQVAIPFGKSIQLSLHLLVPLEIINQVATVLYPSLDFSLLSLGFWLLLAYFYFTQHTGLRELFHKG